MKGSPAVRKEDTRDMIRRTQLSRSSKPMKRTAMRKQGRSRTTKTRTILTGEKYAKLRLLKALAAFERCEHCGGYAPHHAWMPGLYDGQLAHRERGANRNSTIDGTLWLCRTCHDKFDNRNEKVVPAK